MAIAMHNCVVQLDDSGGSPVNISGQANRTSARVMQDTMLEPLLEAARTISRRLDGAVGR